MASPPPLVTCAGIRFPLAKALIGVYEFECLAGGRPAYRQIGVSSGNRLWFTEDALEGPMWVVTPKEQLVGDAPREVIARSRCQARWPWEVEDWSVCGRNSDFRPAPTMVFYVNIPTAEVLVCRGDDGDEKSSASGRYRYAGKISGLPAFRQVNGNIRIFFLPVRQRWVLAPVDEGRGGVLTMLARSLADDGSSWASLWPWGVEQDAWESPSSRTIGLEDGDTTWKPDPAMQVRLASPSVRVQGSLILDGVYEARGMVNGRVFFVQLDEHARLESAGPNCLWYAEDRGQWVVTGPDQVGNSRTVRARISSRTWWPWECHLGGTTSPASLGAAPFACAPPWQGGAAMLASSCTPWEEMSETDGTLTRAPGMTVEMIFDRELRIRGANLSTQGFLGRYEYAGLISSRPFFVQRTFKRGDMRLENCVDLTRHVIWYAEEVDQWVISFDFRMLDSLSVEARGNDSAWFPWEVARVWEVSDGSGGFCQDRRLVVEATSGIPGLVPVSSLKRKEVESDIAGLFEGRRLSRSD